MRGLFGGLIPRERRASAESFGHPATPYLGDWMGRLQETASGIAVSPDNARECPEVDACVGLNEDTIATVPLDLFERQADGGRARRDDHPLHQLLHDAPNGWQTSAEFRQMLEGWRETWGNAYARIVSTRSGPQALEPMYPAAVLPFWNAGQVAYRWTPPDGGPAVILLQEEVIHLRGGPPRRMNICQAQSPVEMHRDTIGLVLACEQYLSRFFSGGAVPKAAITVPVGIGDEAAEKLRAAYERRHAGVENMRRIAILDGGLDIKSIGSSNDDAQVVDVHKQAVAKIARIFDTPLFLIGETGNVSNFGTGIEQQSIGFVTYFMRSKFVMWEQALNRSLMSRGMRASYFFEFNIDGLLRGDFKSRMDGYALMIQWGLATPNEIRRLMNLSPIEGGDERLTPLNMVPATKIMDVLLKADPTKSSRDAADLALRNFVELLTANGGGRLALAA